MKKHVHVFDEAFSGTLAVEHSLGTIDLVIAARSKEGNKLPGVNATIQNDHIVLVSGQFSEGARLVLAG